MSAKVITMEQIRHMMEQPDALSEMEPLVTVFLLFPSACVRVSQSRWQKIEALASRTWCGKSFRFKLKPRSLVLQTDLLGTG